MRFQFDPRTDDPRPLAVIAARSAQRQGLVPADEPELTDDYLANNPDGVRGTCRPVADCPGARKHRR